METEAASEGRAHDRAIFEEAFRYAELHYENTSLQFANCCRTFMHQEMESFSMRLESEKEVTQPFKEHEIQRVREAEMHARAATNTEASVYQEGLKAQQDMQSLQKETFRLKRYQEALVAEVQQTTRDSEAYRYRHEQAERDIAVLMQQHGATGMAEEADALWRREYQSEMDRLEHQYQQVRSESREAHRCLADREQQDKDKERHYQEQAFVLQSRTEQLVHWQRMVASEHQAAQRAGLRVREGELHAQAQIAELSQKGTQFQRERIATTRMCKVDQRQRHVDG
jgi:hypothetical protein